MKKIVLGFQHVLAMFGATVTVPLVVGNAIGLPLEQIAVLIQAVLLTMGIATLLQTTIGSKFPIVQGSSFAFIPALTTIGTTISLAAVEGALIVGGLLEAFTGAFGLIGKLKKLFTPVVTGITIMLVGFSLANTAMQYTFNYFGDPTGTSIPQAAFVALLTFFTTVAITLKSKGTLKTMPVIIGATVGYIASIALGLVDFSLVSSMPYFNLPQVMPWGMPVFDVSAIFIILFAFLVSIIESVGDYHAISTIADESIDNKKINKGIASEGLSCTIAGLLGGCGTTSYSENIGLVALTRVSSLQVVQIGAVILILFSLIPKFAGVLASIPGPVLGGLTIALYGMIGLTGLKLIKDKVELNDKNTLVLASSLIVGLGSPQLPAEFLSHFHPIISSILESGMAIGAITAIVLDQLFKIKN
ncbi:uracil-xanthine permease family protein [Methanococcus voltae]|uniref:Uracil-xanthine permease n=1 Tax=Methanococcus voltae (strain ATCC BAA-1334 / A3) TaxID=456320 RepID=D7DT66_METV3|nr:solute carrier family 23 protein [Methanococcus voltae]MCS3901818.1 NCS2 family nucleobase:cation symporter-2 [Methanococcus voltae]